MRATHFILAALGATLLMAGGCSRGNVEIDELRAENARLTQELDALYQEASLLEQQRDSAREENVRLREQLAGMEQQIRRFGNSGSYDQTIIGTTEDGSGLVIKDVAFKSGSADLTDQALAAIRQLANEINGQDYAGTSVIVVGHTDNAPVARAETKKAFGDNWGLSAMRSAAVVRALQGAGVSSQRLRGSFRGEYAPRAGNNTKDGKASNRRVEVFLSL